jgi:hypothetical protein
MKLIRYISDTVYFREDFLEVIQEKEMYFFSTLQIF